MLTVLYQGNNFSKEVIKQINDSENYFSQVIVSTWKGDEIKNFLNPGIEIIELDDPGSDKIANRIANYTRHIYGVLTGLKKSKSEYTLKLRSDFTVDLSKLIREIDKNRINVIDVTTKIYGSFHFCDWLYFAKTEDLINMYNNIDFKLLHWCSIEELLYINFAFNQKNYEVLAPKIIHHRRIDLKSMKKGYKIIPFGKNIFLKPSKRRIRMWNNNDYPNYFKNINDFFIFRYLVYKFNRLIISIYKCF